MTNYQETINKVVRIFGSKYRMSLAERDDLESTIVLHIAELLVLDPAQEPKLQQQKYLRTVVNNCARDYLRALTRQRNRIAQLADYHEFAAEERNPDLQIWLKQVLDALSPEQRKITTIYYGLDDAPPVRDFQLIEQLTGIGRAQLRRQHESAMAIMRRMCMSVVQT